MEPQQILYELLEKHYSILLPKTDVIDILYDNQDDLYRIYYNKDNKGYCFDVRRTLSEEENVDYDYLFYSGWDGFDDINISQAIILIENIIKEEL